MPRTQAIAWLEHVPFDGVMDDTDAFAGHALAQHQVFQRMAYTDAACRPMKCFKHVRPERGHLQVFILKPAHRNECGHPKALSYSYTGRALRIAEVCVYNIKASCTP